jgi:hypothetical protein
LVQWKLTHSLKTAVAVRSSFRDGLFGHNHKLIKDFLKTHRDYGRNAESNFRLLDDHVHQKDAESRQSFSALASHAFFYEKLSNKLQHQLTVMSNIS